MRIHVCLMLSFVLSLAACSGNGGDEPLYNDGMSSPECTSNEGCTEPGLTVCQDGSCVSSNAECGDVVPVVEGMVKNNVADMDFTGEEVSVQLFHKLDIDKWEDGCISRYVMDFSKMGQGCNLHLELSTGADTAMSVTSATLKADSFCPGWSDADEGEYVLSSSSLTLCSTVKVANYMTESACIPGVVIGFGGLLNLVRVADGSQLEIDLSSLVIRGDITSAGDTELVCPDLCLGIECGDDGCGGSCGTCAACSECQEGQCDSVCWTDSTSGLTWQVTPTGDTMNWDSAKSHCSSLDLDGGGWHLPTIGELRTLIQGCPATEDGGTCNVEEGDCLASSSRDSSCSGCSSHNGPADGCYWPDNMQGACTYYWSSSAVEDYGSLAWSVLFVYANVNFLDVNDVPPVRCVR